MHSHNKYWFFFQCILMVKKILLVITIPVTVFSCHSGRQSALAQTVAVHKLEGRKQDPQVVASTRFSFVQPTDSTRFVLSVISEKEFASSEITYQDKIKRDTNRFKIINGEIRLPLATGKSFVVKNNLSKDDNFLEYKYIGYLPDIDKYLMECTGYEWYEYFTVDKQTGDTAIFFEKPQISPLNGKLACVYYDMYQTELPMIQISTYKLTAKQISGYDTTYIAISDQKYPMACTLIWENEISMLIKLSFESSSSEYLRLKMRR
ncbi:hypothetical protein [Xanthocytophaga agilis]|uniref:Lipoprotein n=1 Tax=Xanthocytophaga agilis TaxID=3048010 RepID=A0AAE3R6I7_9BACT|nr:hypothetical protein [Xanthocytophaga agilis]MDJ1502359.1 hypothetical protein [Xanthocytophaga agilis]